MNFNTFFAFINLSGYKTFNVANVRLSHILPKTLSRPSFKSSCGLKKGLPRLTSSKAEPGLEHFWQHSNSVTVVVLPIVSMSWKGKSTWKHLQINI